MYVCDTNKGLKWYEMNEMNICMHASAKLSRWFGTGFQQYDNDTQLCWINC